VVFGVSYAALWVLVIFQTVVLLGLTRSIYVGREAAPPVEPAFGLRGQPVPAFSSTTVRGETITERDLHGRSTAVIFVSPDCQNCSVTLMQLEALLAKTGGNVLVVCRSDAGKCAQLAQTFELSVPVLVDHDLSLSRLFLVTTAPTAVMIDADGRVGEYGHPMGPDDIEALLRREGAIDDLEIVHRDARAGLV
jgi:peroxiredoxin